MLSKKFQLVKSELETENFSLARDMLDSIQAENLSDTAKELHFALYSRLPAEKKPVLLESEESFTAKHLSELDNQEIKPGISIVSCCMNRNENLLKAIKTWIKLPVDEIIIVDWSSNEPVSESIKDIEDKRIKILRVEGEPKWVLTYGFNVGLRFASHSRIYKFDADIEVSDNFIELNGFNAQQFVRGNWKFAVDKGDDAQKFVNGSFGASKMALKEIGYYNELITTYGWDDSDIYKRLSGVAGCKTKFIDPESIVHLEQDQEERLKHQSVNKNLFLGQFEPTEYYSMRNKYLTSLLDVWHGKHLQEYSISKVATNQWRLNKLTKNIPIPPHVLIDAEKYATLEMASWISPSLWRALAKDNAHVERLLKYFSEGAEKDIVLSAINQLVTEEPYSKSLDECILDKLSATDGHLVINLECQGIEQSLSIMNNDCSYLLSPETALPSINLPPIDRKSKENERKLVFVTSLYDEKRQDRLEEYIYCVEQNVKVFDSLVLYYEEKDRSLYNVLKSRLGNVAWEKIIFVIYKERPTFEFLFNTTDILFPKDIICVANADIAADDSAKLIQEHLHGNAFWALSRHEVDPITKEPEGLIMNQLGIPNTFSADMWVYESPRKHSFKANFPIGSFHCDSFINYYVGKSPYELYNPCLDINIYHVHDPIFNSSEEKAIRDKQMIDERLQQEVALNSGIYPLKGSKWCKAESCVEGTYYQGSVDWYNTVIKLHVNEDGSNVMQVLCATLLSSEALSAINCATSIWLMLPKSNNQAKIYKRLTAMIEMLGSQHIYIGIQEESRIKIGNAYAASEFKAPDLINTVKAIRDNEKARFLSFKNEMYQFGNSFGLDYDPAYIGSYIPAVNDIETYKLLKQLNDTQLLDLQKILSCEAWGDQFIPFKTDVDRLLNLAHKSDAISDSEAPEISFITSVYKGAEFMRGYLENIAVAAEECGGEVIIIDANSPQNEQAIFRAFIKEHPEYELYFTYYRLEKDPGLYNCWQYAIERSKAQYVSNANLDDRRSPFQAKVLLDKLLATPNKRGAAAAIRATTARNTSWYTTTDNQYWFTHGYDENIEFSSLYLIDGQGHVKSQNIMHCMPIWDKSLHTKYGYFNEDKYGTSADWAFWLECTKQGEEFLLVPEVLSQYYVNEQSHNRINDPNGIKENQIIADYLGVQQKQFIQQ